MTFPTLLTGWLLGVGIVPLAALAVALWRLHQVTREHKRRKAEVYACTVELERERKERARLAEALCFTQQAYEAMLANPQAMVFIHGVSPEGLPGRYIEVNETSCRKLGYPREKLLTLTPLEVEVFETPASLGTGRPDDAPGIDQLRAALEGHRASELETTYAARTWIKRIQDECAVVGERLLRTAADERIPVEMTSLAFACEGQRLVLSMAYDITARKQVQQAARETLRLFRDFFATSPLGIALYDGAKHLVDVNPAFLRILGIPDRDQFDRVSLLESPFLPSEVAQAVAHGEAGRSEVTFDFDEARHRHLLVTSRRGVAHLDLWVTPLGIDAEYRTRGWLVQALDITARVEAERSLRESERYREQVHKMEALGIMAGGIAHDFNNILTPILGYSEMALEETPAEGRLHQYVQEIRQAGTRARQLVQQILAFCRRSDQGTNLQPVHVAPIVKEVASLLRASCPPTVEVERVIKTDHDLVLADPTQIHQVLMNLCTNARQAIGSSAGQIEIRLTEFRCDARMRSEFEQLSPGPYLRISVRDTGCGMDRPTMERLFVPFFTTKKSGEGTGLGLAMVHGIVSALKGAIKVESALGKGSTFHVALPLLEKRESVASADTAEVPRGQERVLFVDDDPDVARLVEQMLRSLGYQPTVLTQPEEALATFQADPQRYAVVVTDQVMPGRTGIELAQAIHALRPEVPILLCSGYSDPLPADEMRALNIVGFLEKPIVRRTFGEALRQAIEHPLPFRYPPDRALENRP